MPEQDTKKQEEEKKQITNENSENESDKALTDTIIELQKQLEESEKKRKEADNRAVELVKVLRNSGIQKPAQEEKKLTCKELVKKLFD